jgi:hypothetical protein
MISLNGEQENNLSAKLLGAQSLSDIACFLSKYGHPTLPNIFSSPSLTACARIRLSRVPSCAAQILLP